MRCSVMQGVAVCCSVLQCGAMWCGVVRCGAVWCGVLCVGGKVQDLFSASVQGGEDS